MLKIDLEDKQYLCKIFVDRCWTESLWGKAENLSVYYKKHNIGKCISYIHHVYDNFDEFVFMKFEPSDEFHEYISSHKDYLEVDEDHISCITITYREKLKATLSYLDYDKDYGETDLTFNLDDYINFLEKNYNGLSKEYLLELLRQEEFTIDEFPEPLIDYIIKKISHEVSRKFSEELDRRIDDARKRLEFSFQNVPDKINEIDLKLYKYQQCLGDFSGGKPIPDKLHEIKVYLEKCTKEFEKFNEYRDKNTSKETEDLKKMLTAAHEKMNIIMVYIKKYGDPFNQCIDVIDYFESRISLLEINCLGPKK